MAFIESHQTLARHPKTKAAARLLGVSRPAVVGHLNYLWWWAMDFAEDGDLSSFADEDIAEEALWDGDPHVFVDSLKAAGFIDPDGHIHDWEQYAGRLVAKRKANRERMRLARAHQAGEPNPAQRNDVQRTCNARAGATVPNRTVQNPTTPPPTPPEQPTPTPIRPAPTSSSSPSESGYERTLNGAMPKLVAMCEQLDKQLTESWLRQTLAAAEKDVGPLPRDKIGKGLTLALDQMRRSLAAGKVQTPRGLARKFIVDYLREQASG